MAGNLVDYIDICSLCELATESIQRYMESGNYEGAHIHLCAYLLEVHSRFQNGEIDAGTWKDTMNFYRRMTKTVIEESNIQQSIMNMEREES